MLRWLTVAERVARLVQVLIVALLGALAEHTAEPVGFLAAQVFGAEVPADKPYGSSLNMQLPVRLHDLARPSRWG